MTVNEFRRERNDCFVGILSLVSFHGTFFEDCCRPYIWRAKTGVLRPGELIKIGVSFD